MKVGLAIDYFDSRRGGAEWWTQRYAEHLLREGHEVHVVAQDFHFEAGRLPIIPHRLGRIRSALRRGEAAAETFRG